MKSGFKAGQSGAASEVTRASAPVRAGRLQAEACSFRYDHYSEILARAAAAGYRLSSFRDYDPRARRSVILRHDVDWSTDGMLELAGRERAAGATSTWFLRVHAREYNPFEHRTYVAVREVLAMGHELGLHFECVDFPQLTGEDEVEVFRREKAVLEAVFGLPLETASQHRDVCCYGNPDYHYFFDRHAKEEVGILRYAHEPAYERGFTYLSDSNAVWKRGCPCGHLGKARRLQLLTHPDWWFESLYHLRGETHHPAVACGGER